MDISKNLCDLFKMKEEHKVSCVKIIAWSIVVNEGANTPSFICSNMVLNMVLNVVLNSD